MPGGATLITGALGFVGRQLTQALLDDGVPVVALDRPDVVGADSQAIGWDLGAAVSDSAPRLAELIADRAIVSIVHLAGQSSAGASFNDPAGTIRANLQGTVELLEALRLLATESRTVPTLLAVGSAEEYGGAVVVGRPCREDSPVLPLSPYGTSKAAATLLCRQYHRSFGLPVIATRSFAHTGPGHDQRFVFPSFAAQIAAIEAGIAEPVLKVGDLSPERDFLDVRDVVRAYRSLLDRGQPGEIYNVCSGSSLTIGDGLGILLELSGVAVEVTPDLARIRPVDIPWLVGDPAHLHAATGWVPCVAFRDTLRDLLEAARRNLA